MKKNIVFLYLLVLLSHLILQKLLSHCDKGLVKMDMLYLWVEDMKRKHFLIDNNVSHWDDRKTSARGPETSNTKPFSVG